MASKGANMPQIAVWEAHISEDRHTDQSRQVNERQEPKVQCRIGVNLATCRGCALHDARNGATMVGAFVCSCVLVPNGFTKDCVEIPTPIRHPSDDAPTLSCMPCKAEATHTTA